MGSSPTSLKVGTFGNTARRSGAATTIAAMRENVTSHPVTASRGAISAVTGVRLKKEAPKSPRSIPATHSR